MFDINESDTFKLIEGFENYQVDTYGNVYSNISEKLLQLRKDTNGYLQVNLCKNGKKFTKNIHRLVALNFIPNPTNLPQVDHIDGNPANNHLTNLRFCSNKQNQLNTKISKRNTSGIKGICRNRNGWQVSWQENGKQKHKWFKTKEEAEIYRKKMVEKFYDQSFYREN